MANNKIQIKRSITTGITNTTPTIDVGELVFSSNGYILAIGDPANSANVIAIGGARFPGILTANQALVANTTGFINTVQAANVILTSLNANGSYGTNNQVLISNGTVAYWGSDTGSSGSNTQVQFNDSDFANGSAGFTFVKTSNTLAVGNTLTVNNVFSTTQVNSALISVGTIFKANTTGAFHTGTVNAASLTVGANFIANTTRLTIATPLSSNGGTGTSGQVFVSNGSSGSPYWTSVLSVSDVTVSGNLTVLGDLVSLNVATLSIEDSLITLAKDQSSTAAFTDAIDIGFFGTYGNTSNAFVSGFIRDQSDSGIWKIFNSNGVYTNSSIDTANTSAFTIARLQAFLTSGGLVTNSTSANLIANSTFAVGIVANSLTLSTPLVGNSGGTGKSTVTNNALLVGNSTNGYNELALGTSGSVLQSNGTAVVYDTLDGGTF